MRRFLQFSALVLAAGAMACQPEELVVTEDIPTAGVRFIHAVPDTTLLDFRAVDIVENSQFYGVRYRPVNAVFYKNARAGARHFKIFLSPNTNLPSAQQHAMASTVIQDISVTLEAGHNYTFILWGYATGAGTPSMKLDILDDTPPDPGANIAIRVLNVAGLGALDVKAYPSTGAPPGTATWANVGPQSASAYVSMAPAAANADVRFNVTPAGGGAALFADPNSGLTGIPATVDIEATPGTRIAGSAISAIVFPRSVAGTGAPQGTVGGINFSNPGMMFVWDRRPPRAPGL